MTNNRTEEGISQACGDQEGREGGGQENIDMVCVDHSSMGKT